MTDLTPPAIEHAALPGFFRRGINELKTLFYRLADRQFAPTAGQACRPEQEDITPRSGKLSLEVVSHCWQYSHTLVYHLSALASYPPTRAEVTVTVFYCPEDHHTQAMLDYFGAMEVQGVHWNWQPLAREVLFRRSIGRNYAALNTRADWIWYIDCDLIFHQGCIDSLAEALQGRTDALLFPESEFVTDLLEDDNPVLRNNRAPQIVDIDPAQFRKIPITRAVGAYQITHGDVARACGYCRNIDVFQTPSERWRKTYEDRTYRWLLGTQGVRIPVDNIFRIRHVSKGRYREGGRLNALRRFLRKRQTRRNER